MPRRRLLGAASERSPSGSASGRSQGPGPQDAHGLLALVLVEPLDEEHAVEVVDLVLEHPGRNSSASTEISLPSRSNPVRWTSLGRTIGHDNPGTDRQPSS